MYMNTHANAREGPAVIFELHDTLHETLYNLQYPADISHSGRLGINGIHQYIYSGIGIDVAGSSTSAHKEPSTQVLRALLFGFLSCFPMNSSTALGTLICPDAKASEQMFSRVNSCVSALRLHHDNAVPSDACTWKFCNYSANGYI